MHEDEQEESRQDAAVSWFVRLQDCEDEAVWLSHHRWLEADPANARVYAVVEQLWVEADELLSSRSGSSSSEPGAVAAPDGNVVDLSERRSLAARLRAFAWMPAAIAAGLVAVMVAPRTGLFEAPSEHYRTDRTHTLEVTLPDGSSLTLDRNSTIDVRFEKASRFVTLASGQAAFDVRHDAARPFVVTAGDRQVRVLGTAFDVLARNDVFGVSVARGLVSVSVPGVPSKEVRLPAGKALIRLSGADRDSISDVEPDNASVWKSGRLVYLDSTLEAVGRDYERFIGVPVEVSPTVRDLHISGVVKARNEGDLVRQLELLLPIKVVRTDKGRVIRSR